jgi:hypothetical protein
MWIRSQRDSAPERQQVEHGERDEKEQETPRETGACGQTKHGRKKRGVGGRARDRRRAGQVPVTRPSDRRPKAVGRNKKYMLYAIVKSKIFSGVRALDKKALFQSIMLTKGGGRKSRERRLPQRVPHWAKRGATRVGTVKFPVPHWSCNGAREGSREGGRRQEKPPPSRAWGESGVGGLKKDENPPLLVIRETDYGTEATPN